MDGIRNWVVVNVVKQAVIKLVSMLNPAGAIVQAILAIYNVVMFFVENLSRIIEFAKSIIDSVVKIAAGAISSAAGFIEKAMGRTVPIMLAFLARLIGLGGIGKAVKNGISTVRKPIDKVLDRIVGFVAKLAKKVAGKVKGLGKKVKNASKKVVKKLVGWWSNRTKFKAGGESHALFFKGNKPDGAVRVASEEQDLKKFLKDHKPVGSEGELAATYGKAVKRLATLDAQRNKLLKVMRDGKSEAEQKKQAKASLEAWDALKLELVKFMEQLKGASEHKKTHIDYGGLQHSAIGKSATAWPLTIKGENGSEPGIENPIWSRVNLRRQEGGASYYIQGHLINAKLHGPGNQLANLTPITRSANAQHSSKVEDKVKDVVWNRDKKNPEGQAARYHVEAHYGGHSVAVAAVKKKIADEVQDSERQKTMNAIVDDEQKLPSKLVCTAETVERTGEDYAKKGKVFINAGAGTIPNKIPDSVPILAGTPPKVLLRLSLSNHGEAGNLAMVKGIGAARAATLDKAIAAAMKVDADGNSLAKPTEFTSWADFEKRLAQTAQSKGIGSGIIDILKDYRFRGKTVVHPKGGTEFGV